MAPAVALAAGLEEDTGSHGPVARMSSCMGRSSTDLVERDNTILGTAYGRHIVCGPQTAFGRHTAAGRGLRMVSGRWAVVRGAGIARRGVDIHSDLLEAQPAMVSALAGISGRDSADLADTLGLEGRMTWTADSYCSRALEVTEDTAVFCRLRRRGEVGSLIHPNCLCAGIPYFLDSLLP